MAHQAAASAPDRIVPAGCTVELTLYGQRREATVVEDRGYIGPRGERVLRVRVELEAGPMDFDITWDNLLAFPQFA